MSLEDVLTHYGIAALFLGAGIEGETVVIAGGVLAHRGTVSLSGAMAATAAGSFVADQLFFLAGRSFRSTAWVRKISAKPLFARALALLERYPIGFIFAFRFIYGLRTVSPIAIGTSKVPERLFLVINAVAAIIWGITFTSIGYVFGKGVEKLIERIRPSPTTLAIAAGIAATVVLIGWLVWRARVRTRAPGSAPPDGEPGSVPDKEP